MPTPVPSVDAIVILAKGILSDGTVPPVVQHEVDFALGYAKTHPSVTVIFSGTPPETVAMCQYARPSRLLIEDQSRDTIGSAVYTKILADTHHFTKLLVLATADHVNRVQYIFQKVFASEKGNGYILSYHSHQHVFTFSQYVKNKHYERLAWVYAKWWFWTLRDHSNAGLQRHLEKQHFMYRPTVLRSLLKR